MRHNRSKKQQRLQRLVDVAALPAGVVEERDERVAANVRDRAARRDHRPSRFGFALLMGLQRKPVWTGVPDRGAVEARRQANRAAGRARRVSR